MFYADGRNALSHAPVGQESWDERFYRLLQTAVSGTETVQSLIKLAFNMWNQFI